ncbi:hypothetical protein BDK51DRAFT_40274 [Blyttiomyces helicus]|uniref:Uncharacterized protein n=1 Tax=Blyttiomyces helicus TaxID=388810 RepID=A0A4P9VYD5_9FUNG|nr:hypothetical protein BDK51DRAFT_40274 [Blyttiomyces helicus]|eukprot:RKO83763.1 hypothetical protein BDK51DRAFT_40274 [Blyttiomyces helicus]
MPPEPDILRDVSSHAIEPVIESEHEDDHGQEDARLTSDITDSTTDRREESGRVNALLYRLGDALRLSEVATPRASTTGSSIDNGTNRKLDPLPVSKQPQELRDEDEGAVGFPDGLVDYPSHTPSIFASLTPKSPSSNLPKKPRLSASYSAVNTDSGFSRPASSAKRDWTLETFRSIESAQQSRPVSAYKTAPRYLPAMGPAPGEAAPGYDDVSFSKISRPGSSRVSLRAGRGGGAVAAGRGRGRAV